MRTRKNRRPTRSARLMPSARLRSGPAAWRPSVRTSRWRHPRRPSRSGNPERPLSKSTGPRRTATSSLTRRTRYRHRSEVRGGASVLEHDDQPLRDALDLFYLTDQRVADTLKMDERDIKEGKLSVQQGKTGAKRRIEIIGELKVVIDRIMARKAGQKIRSTRLVVIDSGQPMTTSMLRKRFDDAREAAGIPKAEFQMRDLRAKAATDKEESTGSIREARDQLGHTTVGMTEQYIRMRKGMKVTPTR